MNELKKKTIGVFFGGQSPEHEISIITGEFVIAELGKLGYRVVGVYVGRDGRWYCDEQVSKLKFFQSDYENRLEELHQYNLSLSKSHKKLVLQRSGFLTRNELVIEYIFPTFHGLGGEDGTIQGLAEFFGVPYAGCGIHASAVSIDKIFTKQIFNSLNIATAKYLSFCKNDWAERSIVMNQISDILEFPVFVKPARSGSSIGVSKVRNRGELEEALDLAFYYDTKVIVENSVEDVVDLTCAVLSGDDVVVTSDVQESLFESDLFDFSVKYLENGGAQTGNAKSRLVIPAGISGELTSKIKTISEQVFNEIDANGMIRVDFLLNKRTGELFANEINTLPGTLYHHLWKKSGIEIGEVLDRMMLAGFERWQGVQSNHIEYISEVLSNANQLKLQVNTK